MRQAEVVVYLSRSCFYCIRAKHLLKSKGVQFTEVAVDGDPALWDEMETRSGRSTVPQIFIDQRAVGGFSDIASLDRNGQLDCLLFPTTD
ncbi:MAG: glutaredoxin 3 [Gammaproteobacteria bacterium 28-57-27]|nr:MAG: glutaredoxin 3 [Gammaproteobacteria bacterium 28-57-27]